FLGIDVYRPGIGALLARLEREAIGNVRLFASDASDILEASMPQSVLSRVLIFFPDPWPKRRHHKRRLIQPAFLSQVACALRPGGQLHLATDDENYAGFMKACLESDPCYLLRSVRVDLGSPFRMATRFERRGQRLGHAIYDIEALRITGLGERPLDHWMSESALLIE
ncbi:tRNA (guanine-N-7) methyltransferase, partial [mine drainage metagenome]